MCSFSWAFFSKKRYNLHIYKVSFPHEQMQSCEGSKSTKTFVLQSWKFNKEGFYFFSFMNCSNMFFQLSFFSKKRYNLYIYKVSFPHELIGVKDLNLSLLKSLYYKVWILIKDLYYGFEQLLLDLDIGNVTIDKTRRYPLRRYILSVLTHTTAWDPHWGGGETQKCGFTME